METQKPYTKIEWIGLTKEIVQATANWIREEDSAEAELRGDKVTALQTQAIEEYERLKGERASLMGSRDGLQARYDDLWERMKSYHAFVQKHYPDMPSQTNTTGE